VKHVPAEEFVASVPAARSGDKRALWRVKRFLYRRGWSRGTWTGGGDGKGGFEVCLVQALSMVARGDRDLLVRIGAHLGRATGIVSSAPPLLLLVMWNDAVAKTVDDVVDLVDRAIAGLESAGPVGA
jgi:hypothetical protein